MNKLLNNYYNAIEDIAKEFFRIYFFNDMVKDQESEEKDFDKDYKYYVYRIGSTTNIDSNDIFDFMIGTYYFNVNDMYVALKHNIPFDIIEEWYQNKIEKGIKDFSNLHTFYEKFNEENN